MVVLRHVAVILTFEPQLAEVGAGTWAQVSQVQKMRNDVRMCSVVPLVAIGGDRLDW